MTIIGNGKRYTQTKYSSEKDFEEDVVLSSKMLFGRDTIYINAKKKIDSKSLGAAVPDGFFFDFSDSSDPQFYIVEVELREHSFYNHIFPQVTKFFAFFKNTKLQKSVGFQKYGTPRFQNLSPPGRPLRESGERYSHIGIISSPSILPFLMICMSLSDRSRFLQHDIAVLH